MELELQTAVPCGCLGLSPGPLEEQQFFTSRLSCPAQRTFFFTRAFTEGSLVWAKPDL